MHHVVTRAVGSRAVLLFGSGFIKIMQNNQDSVLNNGWGSRRYKKLWICMELPSGVMKVTTLLLVMLGNSHLYVGNCQ
jgi:hypothetical protein